MTDFNRAYIDCATSDPRLEPLEFALATYIDKCSKDQENKVADLKEQIITLLRSISTQKRTSQAWETFSILCRYQGLAWKTPAFKLFSKWVDRLYDKCDLSNIDLETIQGDAEFKQKRTSEKLAWKKKTKEAELKAQKENARRMFMRSPSSYLNNDPYPSIEEIDEMF